MKLYSIYKQKGGDNLISYPGLTVGLGTNLVHSNDGTALLFSSIKLVQEFITEKKLRNIDIQPLKISIGSFLATVATIDWCTKAIIDGIDQIVFLSCSSGYYTLPSHFYRWKKRTFQSIWYDNQWHDADIDPEYPTCGCGSELGPYNPSGKRFIGNKVIPNIFQVIAGGHTTFDGVNCATLVRIDMLPPKEDLYFEVLLYGDDNISSRTYLLTPDGLRCTDTEDGQFELWDVCPLSGLVSICIHPIMTRSGIDKIQLRSVDAGVLELIDPPHIEYELIPKYAAQVLNDLRRKK